MLSIASTAIACSPPSTLCCQNSLPIAYYHLAYEKPSQLKFGSYTILSSMGPQQGDPLGPLLFCLPLQTALLKLTFPLAFGFLDDISLGGPTASVAADMASLEADCADFGLSLNR